MFHTIIFSIFIIIFFFRDPLYNCLKDGKKIFVTHLASKRYGLSPSSNFLKKNYYTKRSEALGSIRDQITVHSLGHDRNPSFNHKPAFGHRLGRGHEKTSCRSLGHGREKTSCRSLGRGRGRDRSQCRGQGRGHNLPCFLL